jgi:hypothetical protein
MLPARPALRPTLPDGPGARKTQDGLSVHRMVQGVGLPPVASDGVYMGEVRGAIMAILARIQPHGMFLFS